MWCADFQEKNSTYVKIENAIMSPSSHILLSLSSHGSVINWLWDQIPSGSSVVSGRPSNCNSSYAPEITQSQYLLSKKAHFRVFHRVCRLTTEVLFPLWELYTGPTKVQNYFQQIMVYQCIIWCSF